MTDVLYLPEEVDWIKFNVDMSGYYIVHYEGSGWDDLIALLNHNHTALSSNDRASLINNAFQLVRCAACLPYTTVLRLCLRTIDQSTLYDVHYTYHVTLSSNPSLCWTVWGSCRWTKPWTCRCI